MSRWGVGRRTFGVARIALLAVSLALPSAVAQAQFIDGRATGVGGTTIDFNGIVAANFTPLAPIMGVTFANAYFLPGGEFGNTFADGAAYNFNATASYVLSIQFGGRVNASAFNVLTGNGTTTFTAFLNGASISSFSSITSAASQNVFFGFEQLQFDRIDITTRLADIPPEFIGPIGIDNVQFVSAVVAPEPASVSLVTVGLIALGGATRRRIMRRRTSQLG